MTADEFRACVKALGLTPIKPSYNGATLHQDSEGEIHRVIDPDELSEEERRAFYELLKDRLGIHVSQQHLHRYLAEFDFRYSNRMAMGIGDEARANLALRGITGKRLTYRSANHA